MSLGSAFSLSRRTGLAFAAIGFCWGPIAALVPQLKAQIGASDALFGVLLLASAGGLVSATWLAPWADRRLGVWGLPVATVVLASAIPMLGLAGAPWVYGCALLVLGMASGLVDVLANARVSENEARHGRSLMNVNHAIFSMAYAAGAVMSGLGRELGAPPALILSVPALIVLGLASLVWLAPEAVDDSPVAAHDAMPWTLVLICGAIVLVAFGSEATIESWSALHIERTLGGRAAEGALGPALLGVTMAIGRMAGQAVTDRWSDWRVLIGASLVTSGGVAMAAMAGTPAVAYSGFAVAGLGVSVIGPIGIAMVGRLVPPRHRTTAIARVAVLGFCGFFLAPVAMGLLAQLNGLRVAFGSVACFVLLVLPLLGLLRWRLAHRAARIIGR